MEFLELVNCLHEGLDSLQVLSSVTQFYDYFVLRNQWQWHNINNSNQRDSLASAIS